MARGFVHASLLDEDKNGYLNKSEMAILIKKMFSMKKGKTDGSKVKYLERNHNSLTELMGDYARNFSVDLDQKWD